VSAWVAVVGPCWICRSMTQFNPSYCPSVRVHGTKQPICADCMTEINARRRAEGLAPHPVHPDAYEPADESEVLG
jgi:hypothetical protein